MLVVRRARTPTPMPERIGRLLEWRFPEGIEVHAADWPYATVGPAPNLERAKASHDLVAVTRSPEGTGTAEEKKCPISEMPVPEAPASA